MMAKAGRLFEHPKVCQAAPAELIQNLRVDAQKKRRQERQAEVEPNEDDAINELVVGFIASNSLPIQNY